MKLFLEIGTKRVTNHEENNATYYVHYLKKPTHKFSDLVI